MVFVYFMLLAVFLWYYLLDVYGFGLECNCQIALKVSSSFLSLKGNFGDFGGPMVFNSVLHRHTCLIHIDVHFYSARSQFRLSNLRIQL